MSQPNHSHDDDDEDNNSSHSGKDFSAARSQQYAHIEKETFKSTLLLQSLYVFPNSDESRRFCTHT